MPAYNYMNLNQFAEAFFKNLQGTRDRRIIAEMFKKYNYIKSRLAQGEASADVVQNLISAYDSRIKTETGRAIFQQILNAMQDQSPAATDFLNMADKLTTFDYNDAWNNGTASEFEKQEAAKLIMNIIGRNRITDPQIAYMMLQKLTADHDISDTEWIGAVRMQAMNPYATIADLYNYARNAQYWDGPPDELMKMLNDQMAKVDGQIRVELDKDFPNPDNIRAMQPYYLKDIAQCIRDIVASQSAEGKIPSDEVRRMDEMVRTIGAKYDMNKILEFEQGNYVQQFEDQASLQLAKATSKITDMEHAAKEQEEQIEAGKRQQTEANRVLDTLRQQIKQKDERISALQQENRTLATEKAVLRGTVLTYIKDAEERLSGGLVNVRGDMRTQIAQLRKKLEDENTGIRI